MKLFLSRDQAKGLMGGTKFELTAKAELTAEEGALVSKYKADKEVLMEKQIKIPFTDKAVVLKINIGGLMAGQTFTCKDIADIIEYESNIREACGTFKNYLEVMKNFGGREVVEY